MVVVALPPIVLSPVAMSLVMVVVAKVLVLLTVRRLRLVRPVPVALTQVRSVVLRLVKVPVSAVKLLTN